MAEELTYFTKTVIATDVDGIATVLLTGVECTVFDELDNPASIFHPVTKLAMVNPFPVANGVAAFWAEPAHYRVNFVDTNIPQRIAETNYHWDALSSKPGGSNADFLEDNTINVNHLMVAVQRSLIPIGVILPYGGAAAPDGFFLADGSEKAVATYPGLDALLGTTYGPRTNGAGGAGTSHFRLPNLCGRLPIGAGSGVGDGASGAAGTIPAGTALTVRNLGAWRGKEAVKLTAAESGEPGHNHTVNDPGHGHNVSASNAGGAPPGGGGLDVGSEYSGAGGADYRISTTTLGSFNWRLNANNAATGIGLAAVAAAEAAQAHTNLAPELAVNYIIRHGL